MADKLSWSELRHAVAARANVSEKVANTFLTALNAQIIEALKSDKQVKINGLGTFKLQAVAPRKSVDVTTGEEITIEGYNKVAFVPESAVKELVENNPLKKLGEQAEEIVDILGELGQNPKEEPKAEAPKAEEPKVEEPKPEEPKVEEPKPEEPKAEEPVKEEPKAEEPVVAAPEPAPTVIEKPKEEKPKKKSHFWRDLLICVVILLLLLLGGYFFLREQISGWVDSLVNKVSDIELFKGHSDEEKDAEKALEAAMEEWAAAAAAEEAENEALADETVVTEEAPAQEEVYTSAVPEFRYTELLKTETLTEGSRLAWVAKKAYGSQVYWPYVYAANKDRLGNPHIVVVGTEIRVPKLTPAQLDTTRAETIRLLERLMQEAEDAR